MHNHVIFSSRLTDPEAYEVVQAVDEHAMVLQEGPIPFTFHPPTAWRDLGIPLHPGAEAYYRDRGYLRRNQPVLASGGL
jgi:TRAP-type uncharacterized transport system substrate-binding protein